jgi:hypothetical protein|tara:strand:+ start:8574 stop:9248 length:675 start_codon:yes stop_codon:yes gene_type:complete
MAVTIKLREKDGDDIWSGESSLDETDLSSVTQGSMIVGDASGLGSEVDASAGGNILVGNDTTMVALDGSGDTKILVGNATTMTSVALSGGATMTNAGVVTIASVADSVYQRTATARTATADGLTTAIIAAGTAFVTVTSGNADHIITLPAPVIGTVIWLRNAGTGYELRSDDPANNAINGGTGAGVESAVGANVLLRAVCDTATTWVVSTFSTIATEAALEAAA